MKKFYSSIAFSLILSANNLFAQLAGDFDYSFGDHGIVATDIDTSYDYASAMAIQSDGKIVVAGKWTPIGQTDFHFGLTRYNTDGTLDTSFGIYGKVSTTYAQTGGSALEVHSLKLQTDGKILLAGGIFSSDWNFGLLRFNTDGSLDSTFNSTGVVATDFGAFGDIAQSMDLQADGKIILAGSSDNSAVMIRYNSNGSVDSMFGSNGIVTNNLGFGSALAIQTDGNIILCFTSSTGNALVRYDSLGIIDPGFTAPLYPLFPDPNTYVNTIALQNDGKILIGAGVGTVSSDFGLARLNTDGSVDSSFSDDGITVTIIGAYASFQSLGSIAIQTDGKIVVTGQSQAGALHTYTIVRYQPDGGLDSSFNADGIREDTAHGYFLNVALQSDGKIVVAGYFGKMFNGAADYDFLVARLLAVADSTCNNTITLQPASATVNENYTAIFTVSVSNQYAKYQWQTDTGGSWQDISNTGQYSGANNDTLLVTATTAINNNQNFRCIITYGISCADTSDTGALHISTVDIKNTLPGSTYQIYPNPNTGKFTLELGESYQNRKVEIQDILGHTLFTIESNTERIFDFSAVAKPGLHFLSIYEGNSKSTFKVIVE